MPDQNQKKIDDLMSVFRSNAPGPKRTKPAPKPKPVTPVQQFLGIVDGYKPGTSKGSYNEQQKAKPNTFQRRMADIDAKGIGGKDRAAIRRVLDASYQLGWSDKDRDKFTADAENAVRNGERGRIEKLGNNLKGQIDAKAERKRLNQQKYEALRGQDTSETFRADMMSELRGSRALDNAMYANPIMGITNEILKATNKNYTNPIANVLTQMGGEQPQMANDPNEFQTLLRLGAHNLNNMASGTRAAVTGDTRSALEVPNGQSQAEQLLNFLAPFAIPGGGGVGAALGRSALTDVPGLAVGAMDAGGPMGLAQAMVPGQTTDDPRQNFASLLSALGLGTMAGGAVHGLGTLRRPKAGIPADIPAAKPPIAEPPIPTPIDPIRAALEEIGTIPEAAPKPKRTRTPKPNISEIPKSSKVEVPAAKPVDTPKAVKAPGPNASYAKALYEAIPEKTRQDAVDLANVEGAERDGAFAAVAVGIERLKERSKLGTPATPGAAKRTAPSGAKPIAGILNRPKAEVVAPKAKEPWEMTRAEWMSQPRESIGAERDATLSEWRSMNKLEQPLDDHGMMRYPHGISKAERARINNRFAEKNKGYDASAAEYARLKSEGKLPKIQSSMWMRGDGLDTEAQMAHFRVVHKRSITKALTEGKPVPKEVLADYPDLQPKPAPPAKPANPLPKDVVERRVKIGDTVETLYTKLVNGEVPIGSQLFETPEGAAAYSGPKPYTPPAKPEPKPKGEKLTGSQLADAGRKARANASLDNTGRLIRWTKGDGTTETGTLRQHADSLLSEGFTPKAVDVKDFAAIRRAEKDLELLRRRRWDQTDPAGEARAKAVIENPPIKTAYRAMHPAHEGRFTEISKAQFDYMTEKASSPTRTKADIKADLKEAFKDLGSGGNSIGSGPMLTPKQIQAIGNIAKLTFELGHVTWDEAVKHLRTQYADVWSPAIEAEVKKAYKKLGGRTAETAGTTSRTKKASPSQEAPPPAEGNATGLARQFEDPERKAAGKEPTAARGYDAKSLAEAGEKAYRESPAAVADMVKQAHADNRLLTEREVARVTAYKRDIVNEQSRIAGDAQVLDSPENIRYVNIEAELDRISDLAQVVRSKFHSLGIALQTAFNADFSVADLARKARTMMGKELPAHIEAKFKHLEAKYAQALQDLEAARKDAESKVREWTPTVAGRKLERSAAFKLKKLGLEYRGDLDLAGQLGGGMRSKRAGAVNLPAPTPELAKAISDFARGKVYENGFTNLDDLIKQVQKDFPALTDDHILGSISTKYRAAKLQQNTKMAEARKVMNEVRRAAEYRQKPFKEKVSANILEVFSSTNRAFQTGADMSAPFIQGVISLTAHPKEWVKGWAPMVKAAVKGGEFADEHYQAIVDDPRWSGAKAAGLDISMPGGSFTAQEEMFAGALVKRMADSNLPVVKQLGKVIEHSEAAFTVYMNNLRWDVFTKLAALDPGDADYLKDVARMVNVATGKGHGKLAQQIKSSPVAGTLMYAPRYTLSQFQYAAEPLAILGGSYKTKMGMRAAAKQYAKTAGVIALTGLLVEMSGGEVEKDPRSTDFGRWKLPNGVTVNVFGRVADPIKIASQLFWGRISQGGKYTDAGDFGAPDFWSVLKGKASPLLRTLETLRTGKRYDSESGKTVNASYGDLAIDNFTPIGGREMVKTVLNKDATGSEKAMSLGQLFGIDSQRTKKKSGKRVPPMGLPTGLRNLSGTNPSR